MVFYSAGPSPKRRRTDGTPTAQEVADTDRTLQAFTGGRQNRWMQGIANSGEEGAIGRSNGQPGPASRSREGAHEIWRTKANGAGGERPQSNNRSAVASNASLPTVTLGEPRASPGTVMGSINLVDYESPYMMDFIAAAPQGDKRAQSIPHLGHQPGLPSPAPSVENLQSPALNTADRPISRTSTSQQLRRSTTRYGVSAATPSSASPGQTTARMPVTTTSAPGPVHAPIRPGSRPNGHSSSRNSTPVLRSNITPHAANPSPVQYAQPFQGQAQPARSTGNPFQQYRMHNCIENFFCKFKQPLNEFEDGRKALLFEAVSTGDIFYLVLSQMFCLQTHSLKDIPSAMSKVPAASYEALERLLCSNRDINPHLVAWFAEFPASVHDIFASDAGPAYTQYLEAIQRFLAQLPQTYPGIVEESRRLQAPPLAQDMAEKLHLTSPVLQMTAFRAISRGFWANQSNRGLGILEELHKIDQDTYFRLRWRRTVTEKRIARDVYVKVYRSFVEYCRQGHDPAAYIAPAEIGYFRAPPPSMMQRPDSAASPQRPIVAHQVVNLSNTVPSSSYQLPGQLHQILHGAPPTGRARPATFVASPTVPSQSAAPPSRLSRLLPSENDQPRAQPVHPDTQRMALHQAHLRSPTPGSKTLPPGAQPLYRHVIGYALNLTPVIEKLQAQTINFTITEQDFANIPKTTSPNFPGETGKRLLDETSHLYRIRCARMPKEGFTTENSWITADNVWPDNLLMDLNGQHLEARRKLHHGRYLPIDATPRLRTGTNALNLYLARRSDDRRPFEYAIAVEIVGVKSHSSILSSVPTISASDSLAAIKKSLAGSADGDDDLIMTSSVLTIGLFDPFTNARMCQTPIRGAACLHRDCFDLETFLSQCKRDKPGYPSVADCWRCPICKSDVRPQTMVKDGFLMQVKDELETKGLLETRAIIVSEDGSWRPKAEDQNTGVRSESLEREEASAAAQKTNQKRAVEIIELD